MERLWAPWRMEYVGVEQRPGCLFCRVIENPDDPDAVVMLNKFPYTVGHLMVAPRAHVGSLTGLDDDRTLAVMRLVRRSLAVLGDVMTPDGFNTGVNQGRVAGAGIPDHVHFHVVPRWNGDTNFMPVLGDVHVIGEALERTREKVAERFAQSP